MSPTRAEIQEKINLIKSGDPNLSRQGMIDEISAWLDGFELNNELFTQEVAKSRILDDLVSYQGVEEENG